MTYVYGSRSNLLNLLSLITRVDVLPPEFDPDFYRLLHDDLRLYSESDLKVRYERYDREAGRIASPAAQRAGFLAIVPRDRSILEIGPFTRPAFRGENVSYFDVLDRDALLVRAAQHKLEIDDCPDKIDYVSPTCDLAIVPSESFSNIFSSHCIEHQPDLIYHLQQVDRILRPDGRYYLAVPDKRYCFDHFIEPSTILDVVDAHRERRITHSFKSVYNYCAMTTHNDTLLHWQGQHDDPRAHEREARAEYASKIFNEANGSYIDVHAWQFTPTVFRTIMNELSSNYYTRLFVERVYDTVYGQNEFMAVLKKPA